MGTQPPVPHRHHPLQGHPDWPRGLSRWKLLVWAQSSRGWFCRSSYLPICRWSLRGTKRVILKRLARDGHYAVKVAYTTEIWNLRPPPLPRNTFSAHDEDMMPGRGVARYSYEAATNTVHLRWEPRDGAPQEFSGPLPARPAGKQTQKLRKAVALLIGLVVVCLGGGAAIGAVISGPSTRFAGTMVGLVGGCVAYIIFARLLTASAYFRGLRRSSTHSEIAARP